MSLTESETPPLWNQALDRLRARVSEQNFTMWLRPMECTSLEDGVLRLRAPNSYVRLWFESNFLEAALAEVRTLAGTDAVSYTHLDVYKRQVPGCNIRNTSCC